MAFEECSGLLDDQGLCHVCVAPELFLDTGAVRAVRVGGAISLPLIIRNASTIKRPLFVTGLWSREDNEPGWHEVKLPWERLNHQKEAPASVVADAMEKVGTHSIEILMAASTRWRWREETFAFVTSLILTAEDNDKSGGTNISIQGENIGAGAMIHVNNLKDQAASEPARSVESQKLALTRSDIVEKDFGLRGMADKVLVPRAAPIVWKGFGAANAPVDGPIVTAESVLAFGRAETKIAGGAGDVRMLIAGDAGDVDADASVFISRHHFDLFIQNNRLMLRVNSQNGLRVNGRTHARGESVELKGGDIIAPLVRTQSAVSVEVGFEVNSNEVYEVSMTQTPAISTRRT